MQRRIVAATVAGLSAVPVAATPTAALPATAQAAPGPHDALERAIVRRVNQERGRRNLLPLHQSPMLARVAGRHSHRQLARDRLSHRAGGSMRRAFSARRVGENVAFVARGTSARARTVVRMWMRSPRHRHVMLSRSFRRIGVGRRYGGLGSRRGIVVTANFASSPR